jgi:hypothetical protein
MPAPWPSIPLRHDRRFEAREIRRLHAFHFAVELEGGRLIGPDEVDRQGRRDLVFQARGAEDAVDQQAVNRAPLAFPREISQLWLLCYGPIFGHGRLVLGLQPRSQWGPHGLTLGLPFPPGAGRQLECSGL